MWQWTGECWQEHMHKKVSKFTKYISYDWPSSKFFKNKKRASINVPEFYVKECIKASFFFVVNKSTTFMVLFWSDLNTSKKEKLQN